MRDRAGPDAFRPKPVFTGYGHVVTEADRALWQRWVDARAQDAYRRGVEASGAGDRDAALFWLGRAARMARENPNVVFALGMAYFSAEQWDRAIASLDWLIARFDLREAYVAAVVARLKLGRLDDAVESLGRMLGRFAPSGDIPPWMGQLAAYGTFPGWCAADNNGSVKGEALGPVAIMLDGRVVAHDVALPFALPEVWRGARVLRVTERGKDLLGSPVALDRVRRCEGLVRIDGDRVHGWIWYPADPEFVPEVTLDDGVHVGTQRAEEYAVDVRHDVPLARARVFSFRLAPGPDRDLLVRDGFGQALSGSPLRSALGELMAGASARALPEDLRPRRVPPVRRVRPDVQARPPGWLVVIPVFRDADRTLACLRSVLAASDDAEILVVDDATPEPRLARALDRLAGAGRITLVRNGRNLGFPASVNRGFACAGGRDTVLLNSDTLVAPGWLARLRNVLDGDAETGTATPFSNDASIFSYPSVTRPNDVPDLKTTRRLDALCARTFDGVPPVDVPTAHGFCMAIRGDCLSQTGGMRSDVFAQGYGEENDFCLRASALGWRHVAANTVFVAHVGSASFGGMRAPLMARNLEILNALYPGYDAMIGRFVASDPLAPRRRALGLARLVAGRRKRRTMLLIAHDGGGGVERVVRMRRDMFVEEGWNVLVLRPDSAGCHLEPNTGDRSNLLFALPEEKDTLLEVLRACDVRAVEWHHLTGHAPLIRDLASLLAVPYDVFLHDYMWFCPRITLVGVSGGYCGEPSEAVCVRCVSEAGSRLGEALTVSGLRLRSRIELSGARRLVAPSHDTARRMQRHFEALSIEVMPWEDDATFRVERSPRSRSRRRVCLAGALGHDKGYDVLLELARDARARSLPLDFVLVGHTPDDDALVATGHVYVTGEYREDEAAGLVRDAKADLGFIASIWPETWCFALGVLWGGGLPVVCFDLGAPAERIRKTAQGWAVPLSMPVERLNEIFLRL